MVLKNTGGESNCFYLDKTGVNYFYLIFYLNNDDSCSVVLCLGFESGGEVGCQLNNSTKALHCDDLTEQ